MHYLHFHKQCFDKKINSSKKTGLEKKKKKKKSIYMANETKRIPDEDESWPKDIFPVDFSVKSLLYVWDYVYLKLMKTETFVN